MLASRKTLDWPQVTKLSLIFLVVFWFWNTELVYPLKLLVVLFHEASHSLAAILTGGRVAYIEIDPRIGGAAWTAGGWRWLILSAGYLGSMLWGALILKGTHSFKLKRPLALLLGAILLVITLGYVRTFTGLGIGLLFSGGLIFSGLRLSDRVNDLLLSSIGLTSMLYALIDIKEDLISRTVKESDAYQLSQIIPLPPVVWGLIWASIALVALAKVINSMIWVEPAATVSGR